jgi:hypothetical protein
MLNYELLIVSRIMNLSLLIALRTPQRIDKQDVIFGTCIVHRSIKNRVMLVLVLGHFTI